MENLDSPLVKVYGPNKWSIMGDGVWASWKITAGTTTAAFGLAVGVATIVQDCFTGGVGIVDNPITIPAAAGVVSTGIHVVQSGMDDFTTLNRLENEIRNRAIPGQHLVIKSLQRKWGHLWRQARLCASL